MKIAVVGSREFPDLPWVERFVNDVPGDTIIISGGARGVDTTAELAAKKRGLKVWVRRPDYERFGKGATFKRNLQIVEDADLVVVFWDGKSRGTVNTMEHAKRLGKPMNVFQFAELRSTMLGWNGIATINGTQGRKVSIYPGVPE